MPGGSGGGVAAEAAPTPAPTAAAPEAAPAAAPEAAPAPTAPGIVAPSSTPSSNSSTPANSTRPTGQINGADDVKFIEPDLPEPGTIDENDPSLLPPLPESENDLGPPPFIDGKPNPDFDKPLPQATPVEETQPQQTLG
jgi:hypothetical protein